MTDFYEPSSPLMQAIKPNIKPSESPPPSLPDDLSSSSDEEETYRRRSKKRVRPSQGDAVLIRQLEPNRPDIAQHAAEFVLDPEAPSETESMKEDMGDAEITVEQQDATVNLAEEALKVVKIKSNDRSPPEPSFREPTSPVDLNTYESMRRESTPYYRKISPKPLRQQPHPINTVASSDELTDNDTLATSPNLAKYTITPSEPIASTLPALQTSPGKSATTRSYDSLQSLPSLKTAVGEQLENAIPPQSATSPSMGRPSGPYYGSHSGPSPGAYSNPSPASNKDAQTMSPPSTLPTHPQYWRTTKSETSVSSAVSDATTPTTISHSPSSAYTTPSTQDPRLAEGESNLLLNGPLSANGPFTSSTFKCTYDGCTAPPFQTQYLLNSHTNVHSQNRPHYCPVKGCPRGAGGKGFKRKNEMIRHGLVHDSPGYVCPFCPNQQHRYPRPDNLQRHVRVHHVDKDKEDPELREVLAQRPDGPNRGRRRRLGS